MSTCPTVRIKANNEQGFVVINESDFESDKNELYTGSDAPVETPAAPTWKGKATKAAKGVAE